VAWTARSASRACLNGDHADAVGDHVVEFPGDAQPLGGDRLDLRLRAAPNSAVRRRPVADSGDRFRDLLAAEWIKLWSLRSTRWVLGVGVLFDLYAWFPFYDWVHCLSLRHPRSAPAPPRWPLRPPAPAVVSPSCRRG
jgi:hypothetical protein